MQLIGFSLLAFVIWLGFTDRGDQTVSAFDLHAFSNVLTQLTDVYEIPFHDGLIALELSGCRHRSAQPAVSSFSLAALAMICSRMWEGASW